jgi:hypothetical protein
MKLTQCDENITTVPSMEMARNVKFGLGGLASSGTFAPLPQRLGEAGHIFVCNGPSDFVCGTCGMDEGKIQRSKQPHTSNEQWREHSL